MLMDRIPVALGLALLFLAAPWSRLRWDFGERSALMAWRLSVLFLTIAMILQSINIQPELRATTMARVFTWLPVLLLPLQFVQAYGNSDTISLGIFSMMIRRRRQHAEKYGLPFREVRFSFDNVYFCATLLAASLGGVKVSADDKLWFYPCIVGLIGWAVVARHGKGWRMVFGAALVAMLASSVVGIGGQQGLTALYNLAMGRGPGGSADSATERRTSLGERGRLKQSAEIQWRLYPEQGPLPRLLRIASYNRYSTATWSTDLPESGDSGKPRQMSEDFEGADAQIDYEANPLDINNKYTGFYICPPKLPNAKAAIQPALPRFRLRGSLGDVESFTMLPLPAGAASTTEFVFENFQRNSFGTFRVKPAQPVCDAKILWRGDFESAREPWTSVATVQVKDKVSGKSVDEVRKFDPDRIVPPNELPAIQRIADELELYDGTLEEKIDKLRVFFAQNFRYTRYNQMPDRVTQWQEQDPSVATYVNSIVGRETPTLIGIFLERARAGHCEFFATASALLLREAGVPTRYACGFAVVEAGNKKTGEMVVRGTHAHAWCRAWDEDSGRWLDVDLTPSDWTGLETPRKGPFQDLQDWFKTKREDALVWRDKPGHITLLTACLLAPVGIGMLFILRRLWRSRQRLESDRRGAAGGTVVSTPLATLERAARRILGSRPAGTPLGTWLAPLAGRLANPALLGQALSLHHRLRFDPREKDAQLTGELQALVAEIRRQLPRAGR